MSWLLNAFRFGATTVTRYLLIPNMGIVEVQSTVTILLPDGSMVNGA